MTVIEEKILKFEGIEVRLVYSSDTSSDVLTIEWVGGISQSLHITSSSNASAPEAIYNFLRQCGIVREP